MVKMRGGLAQEVSDWEVMKRWSHGALSFS